MTPKLSLLVFGAILLAEQSMAEKGAFEQILDVNFGKGLLVTKVLYK